MLTMLLPRHALDEACRLSMSNRRESLAICRRILSCANLDEVTERAAFNLAMTLKGYDL